MPTAIAALLGFAAWTLLLVGAVAAVRAKQVLAGEKRANEFPAGVPHGGDRYWRLNRAHLNCVENLPLFATLVLAGAILRMPASAFDTLAVVVVVARVAQSTIHIASGSAMAAQLRFTAFVTQLGCFVAMLVLLTTQADGLGFIPRFW